MTPEERAIDERNHQFLIEQLSMETPDDVVMSCMLYSGELQFDDNITGRCEACEAAIQFRPYLPRMEVRVMCITCAHKEYVDLDPDLEDD